MEPGHQDTSASSVGFGGQAVFLLGVQCSGEPTRRECEEDYRQRKSEEMGRRETVGEGVGGAQDSWGEGEVNLSSELVALKITGGPE